MENSESTSNSTRLTFIIFFILVLGAILYLFRGSNVGDKTRTIMIYMSGSDLETKAGAATSDINAIIPKEVDLSSLNIILYTGGSTKWHNDLIDNNENAIYELKGDGFDKKKTYSQYNMSSSETLASFVNYVYDNYKSEKYDLIIWDHGGAWQGAVSDDFNKGDYLELNEFQKALDETPFKNEKMEAIIFKTCLNSSYEVSVALSKYANYLMGSEEVTFAGNVVYALDFLNNIDGNTDPVTIGKKFAESYYDNTVVRGNLQNRKVMAFSVVDLSKINNLSIELANFFNGIDLNENYEEIARVRENLVGYGGAKEKSYEVVDTYHLINNLSPYSSYDSEKVLKAFDEAVVNCYSTNEATSKCLSIFFPFDGVKKSQDYGLKVYKELAFNDDYYNFIDGFIFKQSQAEALTSMLSLNEGRFTNNIEIKDKILSLLLTNDEKKDILDIKYYVFKKDNSNYKLIKTGNDTTIDGNNLLIDLSSNYLKVEDEYINVNYLDNEYTVNGYLNNDLVNEDSLTDKVTFNISENNKIDYTVMDIGENVTGMLLIDYKNYNYLYFDNNTYVFNKIFDNNWKNSLKENVKIINKDNLDIKFSNLDNGEYYCLLEIKDLNNVVHYTKLERIK